VVAKEVGCSVKELQTINPELLRKFTPPNIKSYKLKIPVGSKPKFLAAYDGMPSPKETSWVKHKIRSGETVSTIAARYGVSQYTIFEANNLSRRSRIFAGKQLIVPVPLDRAYKASPRRKPGDYKASNSTYVVRSGDTMWDIAKAFGTTVDALRRSNYIERGSRIYVGQKVKIPASASKLAAKNTKSSSSTYAAVEPKKKSSKVSRDPHSHTVRSGDTIWDIARKYGTTSSKIRRLNSLGRSSRIYPGQVLKVNGNQEYVIHKVRRGETLSRIAQRYRISISRIISANDIGDPDELTVGAKLKIYTK
jgi:membrane-bound lytic murein transglycosylase D